MSLLIQTKSNFTAGELSADLLGRGDLRAYDNGARELTNVVIAPTGGVSRRAGLRFLDEVPGTGRLVSFEFNTEQVYLLALTDGQAHVFMEGSKVATFATPWSSSQLPAINWTQSADTLLVVHPETEPRLIRRSSHTAWTCTAWVMDKNSNGSPKMPYNRIARSDLSLKTSGPLTGSCVIHADKPCFSSGHAGVHIVLRGVTVRLDSYTDSQHMAATILGTLSSADYTLDWTEQAFSAARGWPVSMTFHQDRLVIGGSRDLPNHLWLSRSSSFFDFSPGTGLDDEGIDFALLSDQVNAVRQVFPGRHLQVMTTGAEWMVSGDPLTPTNISVRRQTRIGSPPDINIPPRDVDGATLFVSNTGKEVREFLFSDSEQAYQSTDLTLLARHMLSSPVDMDYDPQRRLVHLVNGDGTLATVTNFRSEQVTAWTRQTTSGTIVSLAVAGDQTFVLVERNGRWMVEQFDDSLGTDSALTGSSSTAKTVWSGLGHLTGQTVKVKADGSEVDDVVVDSNGRITLAWAASSIEAGLAFTHVIEPFPPLPEGPNGGGNGRRIRLVRASFRLLETPVLRVDVGRGLTSLTGWRLGQEALFDTPPQPFTGDASLRALGWTGSALTPLWRIEQSSPLPCTVLSVTTETKASN